MKNRFFLLFYDLYKTKNNKLIHKPKTWIKASIIFIILSLIVLLLWSNKVEFYGPGWTFFSNNLKQFFHFQNFNSAYPSTNLWLLSWNFLLQSLTNLLLGTILGWITAMITAFSLSQKFLYKPVSWLFQGLILALRAFPVLIFIQFFSTNFNGSLAATIIFWWFTWLWLHKYFTQMIQGLNFQYYYLSVALGWSKISAFIHHIWNQSHQQISLFLIFAIESNLRWLSILGALGITNIGSLIYGPIVAIQQSYSQIFIPFLFLFVTLIFFEMILIIWQKHQQIVVKIKDWNPQKLAKKRYYFNYYRWFFACFILAIIIYGLSQIQWQTPDWQAGVNYLQRIFQPQVSYWASKNWDVNPLLLFLPLLQQTISVVLVGFVLGLFFGFLSSSKVVNKYVAWFFSIFNLLMRTLPVIFLYYLINPLLSHPQATAIIVLSFHISFTYSKKVNATLQNIPDQKIHNLRQLGYSWWWIFSNYLFAQTKNKSLYFLIFEFENTLRSVIFLGVFGTSLFGQYLNAFSDRNPDAWATFIWTFWGFIFIWEVLQWGFWNQWQNKLLKTKCFIKSQWIKIIKFIWKKTNISAH